MVHGPYNIKLILNLFCLLIHLCRVYCVFFLNSFITQKICAAYTRTSYKIVPLTNLNKYLHNEASETEVNINIRANKDSKKLWKQNTAASGKLFIAVYASYSYTDICCTLLSGRLQYNSLFVGLGCWGVSGKFGCKSVDNNADGLDVLKCCAGGKSLYVWGYYRCLWVTLTG